MQHILFYSGGLLKAEVAYCVKCKKKADIKDTQEVTMKNGSNSLKGKCTVCGTGMYKILGK